MNRALTKKDLIISLIVVATWVILGFGAYRYPKSRTLAWLFWISFIGPSIPRFVRVSLGLWIACHRMIRRAHQSFSR